MGYISNNQIYMEFEDRASGSDFGSSHAGFTWDTPSVWSLEFSIAGIHIATNDTDARGCDCSWLGFSSKWRIICCLEAIEACRKVYKVVDIMSMTFHLTRSAGCISRSTELA